MNRHGLDKFLKDSQELIHTITRLSEIRSTLRFYQIAKKRELTESIKSLKVELISRIDND